MSDWWELYAASIPEGADLVASRDTPGWVRGFFRDAEGIGGHAEFAEVDLCGPAAVVAAIGLAVGVVGTLAVVKKAPRIQRWWEDPVSYTHLFEENLRFVTESLGVKDIRDYFVRSFYRDHVQRYKKRPIYWLFSSPKGSFNALIYMHRYTPSTVSTVLNEYLREFTAKLTSSLQQQDRLAAGDGPQRQPAAAQKEADRLRKVLLELEEYEHDVLYPLASRQLAMDLDDGVKANYPKFGAALKKIPGLEASDE